MNVHDEFTRRVAADRLCRELMRAIAENDTAALERLGMRGFGLYAGRLSELMTDSVRLGLTPSDDFGEIMRQVNSPARYAHHLVNEGGSAIQQALDRRNGVRLRVVEPEFNDGRLKGIVGEASESDSENAADNLATQLGTFVKDAGNEFMKQNAEQRDRAGFKVTITRTGGAKCCPWCADRTGTWELKAAPDGVFGVHDNCKCMVDYTNSKGTVRGKAVTHKIDGKTVTKWEFAGKIPYTPPRVLTREEAAARGGFDKPKRLTGWSAKPGKDDKAIADLDYIFSQAFEDKFKGRYANDKVEQTVIKACRQIIKNRNGTYYEEAYFIDANTGAVVSYIKGKHKNGVDMPEALKKRLTNARENSIIMIHNHPNSSPFSTADFITATGYGSCYEAIACGHNGSVYSFRNAYHKQGAFLGYIKEDGKKIPYYEGTRDYYIAFAKYRRTNDDFNARHLAWESTARTRGFEYERR